jgi:hypothetical protein
MKKIAILLIVLIMVSVGFLSGCNESNETKSDTDKVELVSYTVSNTWDDGKACKTIEGTFKNIAGTLLSTVIVEIMIYDLNNHALNSYKQVFTDIPNSYTKDFSSTYREGEWDLNNIDWTNIEFNFYAS